MLVGHSFGGPVVRNFAATYPRDVAGMVLVDAAFEGQRVEVRGVGRRFGWATEAKGLPIAEPREEMKDSDRVETHDGGCEAGDARSDV